MIASILLVLLSKIIVSFTLHSGFMTLTQTVKDILVDSLSPCVVDLAHSFLVASNVQSNTVSESLLELVYSYEE